MSDLKDTTQEQLNKEFLISFRILTYTLVPAAADDLHKIYQMLSREDVRMLHQDAFHANGLAVGVGTYEVGGQVARKLAEFGAERIEQTRLVIPPDKTQILSRTFLRETETFTYAASAEAAVDASPGPGYLGWVMSAAPDSRLRGMVQVRLSPAFWQQGIENIRLMMGKEAVEFHPVDEGTLLTRIDEREFIVLGPARDVPESLTLDKLLFYLPGRRPKVRIFLIIFDSMGAA